MSEEFNVVDMGDARQETKQAAKGPFLDSVFGLGAYGG